MKSQMPLKVKRRDGDWTIAMVINAIYENGGLAALFLLDEDLSLQWSCSSSGYEDEIGERGLRSDDDEDEEGE